jgi:thiamine biosynthesis protein ThiS
MQVLLNGVPQDVPAGVSLAELLRQHQLTAAHIAVEINEEIVPRRDHEARTLQPCDRIEIATLAGGG